MLAFVLVERSFCADPCETLPRIAGGDVVAMVTSAADSGGDHDGSGAPMKAAHHCGTAHAPAVPCAPDAIAVASSELDASGFGLDPGPTDHMQSGQDRPPRLA